MNKPEYPERGMFEPEGSHNNNVDRFYADVEAYEERKHPLYLLRVLRLKLERMAHPTNHEKMMRRGKRYALLARIHGWMHPFEKKDEHPF